MTIRPQTIPRPLTRPTTLDASSPENPARLSLNCVAVEFDDVLASETSGPPPLPRFKMLAYTGGPMQVAGWRYPVILDLAGLSIPSQARPIRFGHDPLSGVGHSDAIRIEQGQLVAAGIVSRDTAAAREVVVSSKNGFPWQASMGASVEEFEFVRDGQQVIVNGRTFDGPVNVVRKSTLGEISFVDLGADGSTSASIAAQQSSYSPQPGAPPVEVTTPTQSEPSTPTPAPVVAPPTPSATTVPAEVQAIRAAVAAETQRINAVRKLTARYPELAAKAISEGWDVQKTELEVLRASRPSAPSIHVPDNTITPMVLEAACVITSHGNNFENDYDERTLDLASRRYRGGIGLQELLLEAAWANGYTGRNFRDSREVLRYAFGHHVEAAYSTIDIGPILANVANKFLLDGFFSVERVWREICAVRNVSDFKTVTSYRLVGKDQYEVVAPGGELKHGSLGGEVYTNKADTYGLMLSIDRRDMINDDLGAITTVPRKLGRGSGLKINDVFWTMFLNNSAFFAAGNNNFLAGANTNLSIDSLTAAEVAFLNLVDSDGKPIGVMPAFMLVPPALSALASQLFKSLEMRDMTASSRQPTANPHQGKYEPKVSRYLSNAAYTGNSAKAWYLLANPSDLPVIEVAFLNGNESPTIETAEADFNVLGVQLRGYHDFGTNLQDPRGGVKIKGEV